MPASRLSDWLDAFERERERERSGIARLLHDDTGGRLTAAAVELTLLRMDAPAGLAPRLEALEQALEAAFASVRAASLVTAPDAAERLPLAEALARMAEAAGRRLHGTLALSVDTEYRPDTETSRALYRISECLAGYLAGEAGATVIELELNAGPVLRMRANVEIERAAAARALGPALARYWAAKTNLRFLFGNPVPGSTMFLITA